MKKALIAVTVIIIIVCVIVGIVMLKSNQNDVNAIAENQDSNSQEELNSSTEDKESSNKKILIAFFSRPGENYSVGTVEVGNTEIMANNIAEITGGDLYKINPVIEYPNSYEEAKKVATREQNENIRPEIETKVNNFEEYDTIFIGYPIWYGDYPMIINTFIESYDFSGKTVIPFNTHEGSGNAGTFANIKNKLSNSTVLDGLSIRGSEAREESSKGTIENWIDKLLVI